MTKKLLKMLVILFVISGLFLVAGCSESESRKGSGEDFAMSTFAPESSPQPAQTPVGATPETTPVPVTPSPAPTPIPSPSIAPVTKAPKIVPILYYHAVNDKIEGLEELFVSPKEFEKQMDFLKQNNYTVIGFDELEDAENIHNPVIITLDDGYEDNYTYAYPVLKKYGFKATIFVVADIIGKPSILSRSQMEEMKDLVDFQGHTMTHPYLTQLSLEDAEREMVEADKIIEEITGKPVSVFAYPFGEYNKQILEITKKHYKYAVCNGGGLYKTTDSPYEMKRVYVPRWLDIKGFENKIKGLGVN